MGVIASLRTPGRIATPGSPHDRGHHVAGAGSADQEAWAFAGALRWRAMVLLRLVGLLVDVLLLPLRWLARRRAVRQGSYVSLVVDGALADMIAPAPAWRRFVSGRAPKKTTSLHAVTELVDVLVGDARVRGLVVTLKHLSSGMAGATSLRDQLLRLRVAGKEVVVHLPVGGSTKEVYVASVATRLVVGPAAQLSPLGFLSASRYAKRAVDKAGLDVEIFACGDYKSAGETLVRDTMSEAQREQVGALLDGYDQALVSAIAEGRGITLERARAVVDGAPYFGRAAVAAGLADDVGYEDEVAASLATKDGKGADGSVPVRGILTASAYLAATKRPLLRRIRRRPILAVIPVHGTIAHADGPLGTFATDERVTRMVRAARLDRRVAGVVLHVDSPGGSALASDRMFHEIAQLARQKPVVACFANVAASGGYYVAAPVHCIVAQPTSVTGSIGVVAARIGVEPLLERLGVRTEVVRRGAHAGLLSPSLPLAEDERVALRRELDATYDAFLAIVTAGRKLPREEVEKLARGRVYTGVQAHAAKLVDVLGGFDVALRELRARVPDARVRDRAEAHLVRAPKHPLPLLTPPAPARAVVDALRVLLGHGAAERDLLTLALTGERVFLLETSDLGA